MGQAGFAYAFPKWQKEYGDIYCLFFGAFPDIVVGDPEIIGEVLVKSFSNFTNRPLGFQLDDYGAAMLTAAKDDHWKYLRTVLAPSFSSKRMRETVPLIEDVLKTFDKKLNDIAESKEARDVTDLFSGYTMDVIASTGFGIKPLSICLTLIPFSNLSLSISLTHFEFVSLSHFHFEMSLSLSLTSTLKSLSLSLTSTLKSLSLSHFHFEMSLSLSLSLPL
ncbi:TBXAS1 [Acanthosepion pharaonis]|uniref:TBXAS1 n=1 Tax=Acanthosepion pharaonis TaxID=158019 RepID=A0A812C9M0_ACAPH|nr:TBXAS1 [Sepia pharaonis]